MATRCGDLESTPGALLAAHITEIRMCPPQERWTLDDRFRCEAAAEILTCLDKVAHGHRYDPRQSGLRRRFQWADEPVEPGTAGGFRGHEHTRNRAESPVERELPNRRVLGESFGRNLARRRKHGERDRKIEPGAFLAKVRRSEIDRDSPQRPLELRAPDPTPDALLGFLASLVRQADDHKCGHASLKVGLHLDGAGLEAHERMGDDARQHALHGRSLRRTKPACFVPTLSQARALFAA